MHNRLNKGLEYDFSFKHIYDVATELYNTRSKQNLYFQRANGNHGKLTFTNPGAMGWNVLPTELRNITVFN
jgi:hypothetical protein